VSKIPTQESVQEWPDARRREVLRAERTGSYVSTQDRLTTPQMAVHGQTPLADDRAVQIAVTHNRPLPALL